VIAPPGLTPIEFRPGLRGLPLLHVRGFIAIDITRPEAAEDVEARLKQIREALRETPAAEKQLGAVADSLEQRNRETLRPLRSDVEIAGRSEPVPLSINDRLSSVMEGERFSLQKPTQTDIDSYNIAAAEFADQLAKLHGLVEVDLIKLEKDMEAAGAPWTPGRVPDWPGN